MVTKFELPTKERVFCPKEFRASRWEEIEPLFQNLLKREVQFPEELEEWILNCNELLAILQEEEALRFIRTVCHTDNQEFERAYMEYVEQIKPKLKPLWNQLHQMYLQKAEVHPLPEDRYGIFYRSIKNQVDLFAKENIPLHVEVARLGQEYQKIQGAMTVEYEGKEKTLSQLAPLLQEKDRALREKVWRIIQERRGQDRERLDEIFDKLFALRVQVAKNAHHPDYRSYCFAKLERFDYTPEDCLQFHQVVEKAVVPHAKELAKRRKEALGLDTLRPWDTQVSPSGRPPLKPFKEVDEMVKGCIEIFRNLDPEFAAQLTEMSQLGLLDLDNRKGKAPGGFQHSLEESKYPFIFMNSVGLHRDLETLLHEAGHAFNFYACKENPLVVYRHPPMEFAEVASMTMELISAPHWNVFYKGVDLLRAKKKHLDGIVNFFPWCCTIDAFQHELYTHPNHNREDREGMWLSVLDRFDSDTDWSGLENYKTFLWQRQLHLYEVPFYYIEYGLAQMGALQIWIQSLSDSGKALENYKKALALGGSKSLKEIYDAANIKLIFTEEEMVPIMEGLMEELDKLDKELKGEE